MENKKKYKLETVNCPLCSSKNYKAYIKKAKELYGGMEEYFDVCECKSCSHKWTNPRLTKDTIRYFYPYYQPIKYSKKQDLQYEIYKKILNIFFGYKLNSPIFGFLALITYVIKKQDIEVTHIPKFLDDGKVLDIGCSYDLHLKKMQNYGRDAYVTELNQKAVSYANNLLESNGFKVEQIIHQKINGDLVASAGYMPNQTLAKFLHNKIIRKSFVKIFINILVLLGKTSRMSIYARKI